MKKKKEAILWCICGFLGVFWVVIITAIIYVFTLVSSITEVFKNSSFYDEMYDKAVEDGEKLVNQYGEEFKRKLYEYYGKEIQIEGVEGVMYSSGGIGPISGEEYAATRKLKAQVTVDGTTFTSNYDTRSGMVYTNKVVLEIENELKKELRDTYHIKIHELNLYYFAYNLNYIGMIKIDDLYTFDTINQFSGLNVVNNLPEIFLFCIYEGEMDKNAIEEISKDLFKNNHNNYNIEVSFIEVYEYSDDVKKTAASVWKTVDSLIEWDSSVTGPYDDVKSIKIISNKHTKNKDRFKYYYRKAPIYE